MSDLSYANYALEEHLAHKEYAEAIRLLMLMIQDLRKKLEG
jgi:hypothetical protein